MSACSTPCRERVWTRRLRGGLTVLAMLAAGAFAGLNLLAYRHAHAMMHFSNVRARTGKPETLNWRQKFKVLACGAEIPRASAATCPALFLHGSADLRARVEEARRVFDAVPGAKRFQEFPGNGHVSGLGRYPEKWKHSIADFLQETGIRS
jgi:pimeloyl-ACP methyl ester carboxylesterase